MDIETILAELRAERQRIDSAIAALEGGGRSSAGRGPGIGRKRRGPRKMSAEARKRISDAQKARWAKVKKASKKS